MRARLLIRGVRVRDVADRAGLSLSLTCYVISLQRPATTPGGRRIVAAAEELSGLTWDTLIAPLPRGQT